MTTDGLEEYLCIRNGEERGFTDAEFLRAQDKGWEKQCPYLVGKKKVYVTTADGEAQGFKRASKNPKSATYGGQNPITKRWNSESQLTKLREKMIVFCYQLKVIAKGKAKCIAIFGVTS